MIEVIEKKQLKESCFNCLYGRAGGCAHADMQNNWLWYRIGGSACKHYFLDHSRYEIVSEYGRRC